MASRFSAIVQRGTSLFSSSSSRNSSPSAKDGNESPPQPRGSHGFVTAGEGRLFARVDPAIDGEDCLRDCESCTLHYPARFKVNEDARLYGHVKGWATHLLVATGKTDWVKHVEDEKGSVMQAIDKAGVKPKNGRLMLSASNIPVPDPHTNPYEQATTCLLLPAFVLIDNVTPDSAPQLLEHVVSAAPTTTSALSPSSSSSIAIPALSPTPFPPPPSSSSFSSSPLPFAFRRCPHDAVILLCSQRTRDARCGQSAPLLRREFERHLRPLGLMRGLDDERPGGVGIYFVSHVGGHKFSANVLVYRRARVGEGLAEHKPAVAVAAAVAATTTTTTTMAQRDTADGHVNGEVQGRTEDIKDLGGEDGEMKRDAGSDGASSGASQCIWLARVRPEDCEGIVRFTVLQGKVIKPERQLRGGFDRERELCSW